MAKAQFIKRVDLLVDRLCPRNIRAIFVYACAFLGHFRVEVNLIMKAGLSANSKEMAGENFEKLGLSTWT